MSLGGALGGPVTAFQYDWNMLPIGQQLWLKHLLTLREVPAAAGARDLQPQRDPGAGQEGQRQSRERLAACDEHDVTQRAPRDGAPAHSSGRRDQGGFSCTPIRTGHARSCTHCLTDRP